MNRIECCNSQIFRNDGKRERQGEPFYFCTAPNLHVNHVFTSRHSQHFHLTEMPRQLAPQALTVVFLQMPPVPGLLKRQQPRTAVRCHEHKLPPRSENSSYFRLPHFINPYIQTHPKTETFYSTSTRIFEQVPSFLKEN